MISILGLAIIFIIIFAGLYAYIEDARKDKASVCTQEARAGLVITLTDEAGQPVNGATITADGDSAAFDEMNGIYMGLYESSGKHPLTVKKEGYQKYTGEIFLTMTDCHVITEQKTIVLKK